MCRDFLHKVFENFKNENRYSDGDNSNEKAVFGEKNEIKEIVGKWNEEGANHDSNNDNKQTSTKWV